MLKGLHHVGIIVKDLNKSIDFYHRVLGLEFASEPSPWFAGPELESALRIKGACLRQVCLVLGDTMLELLEYATPEWPIANPMPQYVTGASHVSLQVDDLEAGMKALQAKGIEFFSGPNKVDSGVLAGWRWVYFQDPDGYQLELVQIAYRNGDERKQGIEAYKRSRGWIDVG